MKINDFYKPMLDGTRAVLFDLDGTLVDSMWLWRQIDKEFLAMYGHEVPKDLSKCIEGISVVETAHYFINRFNINESPQNIINTWNEMAKYKYQNEVNLKEGAFDFLKYLYESGIKLGICSSNSNILLDVVLSRLNIKEMFGIVISGSDVKKGKPSPECYLKGAEALKTDPINCLVFEDLIPGIRAGKNANMKVCAVFDEYSKADDKQKKSEADYYIKNYKDILDV